MHKKDTPKETINYIREKIKSGSWLIRNIQQRQKTIYRIADEIIRVQQQFFEEGPVSLKPLTMQDVASAISLHESTVSRAIAGKFMQSPQGTFQFKYFFSSGITTEAGESISVANLKNQIADMIKEEDPKNPFSDQEILDKLAAIGIKLARRTIAKYRNDLGIAASSVRRKV
jgi:RNA polymerase sigma-54 factor